MKKKIEYAPVVMPTNTSKNLFYKHAFLSSVVVLDPILCEALHHKTSFVCEELTWAELLERSVMLYSCSVV